MNDALTLARTLRGEPTPTGWVDLSPAAGVGWDGEVSTVEPLATLVHLSDLHICDAESPARQEYLDRYGRFGAEYAGMVSPSGSFRPQEILTVPVAIQMLETVARLEHGPMMGRPLDGAVITGDLTDNAQSNELAWVGQLLRGEPVTQRSGGAHSSWVGSAGVEFDDAYYHPDGRSDGQVDRWITEFGFPVIDGLSEAARQTFASVGLGVPTYAVHGNHDLMVQGSVPADDTIAAVATGGARRTELGAGEHPLVIHELIPGVGPARFLDLSAGPTQHVTADPSRAIVAEGTFADLYPSEAVRGPALSYSAAINGDVRLIALDTVNPHGGWQGSIDETQLEWTIDQITNCDEKYVVIASHHPSWTLINSYTTSAPRVLGGRLLAALLDQPKVIAWMSGHTHIHSITQHRGAGGRVLPEITSASLIDWPQQSRVLEIGCDGDELVLASSAINHASPAAVAAPILDDVAHLASISRSLARNSPSYRGHISMTEQAGAAATEQTIAGYNKVVRVPLLG